MSGESRNRFLLEILGKFMPPFGALGAAVWSLVGIDEEVGSISPKIVVTVTIKSLLIWSFLGWLAGMFLRELTRFVVDLFYGHD